MLRRIAFAFFIFINASICACLDNKFVKMSKLSKNSDAFVNVCSQIQIQELCVKPGNEFFLQSEFTRTEFDPF